ncbi:MAG: hypothetical protein JJ895_00940 [Balneolaceae bacterium]|nr:hypothetical protein [Balneolaceae bacterium]
MLNSEEGCIRYLMREMDPAEEIEFEREMLNDENLLIEVESLRRTYQKLGQLPLKTPPKSIVDEITKEAVKQQRSRVDGNKNLILTFSKAVASVAAAVLIITLGTYFYGNIDGGLDNAPINSTPQSASVAQPWVDRNEVIEFAGTSTQNQNTAEVENERIQSFDRLRLVNPETGFSPPNRKVVLTSTSN